MKKAVVYPLNIRNQLKTYSLFAFFNFSRTSEGGGGVCHSDNAGHTGEARSKNPDFGRTSFMDGPLPNDVLIARAVLRKIAAEKLMSVVAPTSVLVIVPLL